MLKKHSAISELLGNHGQFGLDYYQGALQAAFSECAATEKALGVDRINLRIRLEQWQNLLDNLNKI